MKKSAQYVLLCVMLAAALLAAACGENPGAPETVQSDVKQPNAASAENAGELYVYNWTEYLPEDAIALFEQETGVKVIYSTFDSNETMYAKVKLVGGEGYDIVVPSVYYVSKMARENLLATIDKSRLTNFGQLNPALLDQGYDPDNVYSVPYLWGGTGLLYDTRVSGGELSSWNSLWNEKYQGRVLLQDDVRDVFGVGLLLTGHSINTTDPAEIEEAYELLTQLAPGVLVYNSDSPKVPFLNEEVVIGTAWNGEAYMAMEENGSFDFAWPDEGAPLWMDSFVVLKGARNYDNALKFIDFMLRPDIAAMCSEEYGYATPNLGGIELLPREVSENPVVFPPDEVVARSEFQGDVGEAITVYEKYWEMLRAGQ